MTERLYYDDPDCREFDAVVVRVEPRGEWRAVWLNRSAFYPTSGGQPFDTGRLGPLPVVNVEDEDGDVVHFVQGEAELPVGQTLRGAIDWARRVDHMQHHSGQHVLSAAIVHRCHVPTLSFHLGRDVSTIDLARELTPADLAAVEDDANRVIGENRPVTIRYASADEAATLGLRKPSARAGTLRLIEVERFDLSACGGSHVRQTGAIGGLLIAGWERFKGGQRIAFVCGGRAVRAHRQLRDTVAAGVRLLSVLPSELPAAIERLQHDVREHTKTIAVLRGEIAVQQAGALAATAESLGRHRWVFASVDGDANVLKALGQAVVTRPGLVAVLTSAATPALLLVTRSGDVTLACDAFLTALVGAFGGRGGGRSDLAQAGKLEAAPGDILAHARLLAAGA